jgi:hypothetical protein
MKLQFNSVEMTLRNMDDGVLSYIVDNTDLRVWAVVDCWVQEEVERKIPQISVDIFQDDAIINVNKNKREIMNQEMTTQDFADMHGLSQPVASSVFKFLRQLGVITETDKKRRKNEKVQGRGSTLFIVPEEVTLTLITSVDATMEVTTEVTTEVEA